MILTLTKNRKDMNSEDISSFSTQNPFCWTCCFLEHQNRCIDAMMSSSRHDQMPFICWKCHLFGNSTWAILYSPLVLWLLFFRVQQPEGADQYFFSADQGTKLPVTGAGFPSINCTFQLERWSSTYRWRLLPGFFFEQNHVRGLWIYEFGTL